MRKEQRPPKDDVSNTDEKKCSEETQTLRAGCSKAEPNIFAHRRLPSPGRGKAKI